MRKKFLLLSLALALALTLSMPAAALADDEVLNATGHITYIEPTIVGENAFPVDPLNPAGAWLVDDRDIKGNLNGIKKSGPFVLTYDAEIESVWTQAGTIEGTLAIFKAKEKDKDKDKESKKPKYVLNVAGQIAPIQMVQVAADVLSRTTATS